MENNTEIRPSRGEQPPVRVEVTQPEKPKRERVSITEWMAQTLDEMKRRVGWFKENPEVVRVKKVTKDLPDLGQSVVSQLDKVERKADEALQEAKAELQQIVETSLTPELHIETPRFVKAVKINWEDQEAWSDFSFAAMQEFDKKFNPMTPQPEDFEVSLSAPTSATTLGEFEHTGPEKVRVRSESVAGVRVDAIVFPPESAKISEYRIYNLDGTYRTIPGNQDPIDAFLDQVKTNQIAFGYWIKEAAEVQERKKILRGMRGSRSARTYDEYESPITLDSLIQQHDTRLGTPDEYLIRPERMMKPTSSRGKQEPTIGKLTGIIPPEPKVSLLQDAEEWMRPEPLVKPVVDQFYEGMIAQYGKDIAGQLKEHFFATQDLFDQYIKAWESATHNTSLSPEQQKLIAQVLAALKTEGKVRGLAGKGSYVYLVEAYKKQENDFPRVLESIQTVKEIIADPSTPETDLPNLQKELGYLSHLKNRIESNPKRVLHQRLEKFLDQYQYLLKPDQMKKIIEADQALDQANTVDAVSQQVTEALDGPSRVVLDHILRKFIQDYGRFMPREQTQFEAKLEAFNTQSTPLHFGEAQSEIYDSMNTIKRRAWNRILVESFTRVGQALKRFGEEMDEEAYPVVNNLYTALQQGLPKRAGESFNIFVLQDFLKRFEPVEFERYVTSVLEAATGQDMRPGWQKIQAELRPPSPPEQASETWVQEPKATPVEVEWEAEEPETRRQGETLIPERPAATPVTVEEFDEEGDEYEDVSAEVPGLVRTLRSVQRSAEEARLAANRTREILEQAGSEEMIEVTQPMLQKLDSLKSTGSITEKIYQRALASLISADSFNQREQVVADLQVELPVTHMRQPGKTGKMERPLKYSLQ